MAVMMRGPIVLYVSHDEWTYCMSVMMRVLSGAIVCEQRNRKTNFTFLKFACPRELLV